MRKTRFKGRTRNQLISTIFLILPIRGEINRRQLVSIEEEEKINRKREMKRIISHQ
jgi:hypothetical protein